ncbi:hypothetical protein BU14_0686s0003 [Porphyra umbilicalis]|uniref:DNAJ-containing protein X-domain domain-containing protein n=1 Tax=Porphyra umbilicalis TaxID=2786 RepID=A0A1X6NQA2_PORUM|nr:hypothetical protein BU14_0686s0003 [Porphyra umbilicalis]|eukprot:OSX70700.1 hypothetical protein BU14_0686s0003 [Porphyra umbilicalis]
MVFGSDQFTHLIGELQLASLATHVDDAGNAPSELTMTRLQRQRVGRLAAVLVGALQPWTGGDADAFRSWAVGEAHRLSAANFGSALLHVIGYVYARKANIALGKSSLLGLPGLWKAVSYSTHKLNSQVRATSAASRVLHSQRRLHDRVAELNKSGRAITSAEAHRIACSMTEKAVELFWKMSVIDIQDTLDAVADTVLAGDDLAPMAPPARDALLAERARGLKVFGKILMAGSEASVTVSAGQQRRRRGAAAASSSGGVGGGTGQRRRRGLGGAAGRRRRRGGNDRRRRRRTSGGGGGRRVQAVQSADGARRVSLVVGAPEVCVCPLAHCLVPICLLSTQCLFSCLSCFLFFLCLPRLLSCNMRSLVLLTPSPNRRRTPSSVCDSSRGKNTHAAAAGSGRWLWPLHSSPQA